MAQVAFNIRMDEDLKKEFGQFCSDVGMSMSTAFVMFAKETLREQQIPFPVGRRHDVRRARRADAPQREAQELSRGIEISRREFSEGKGIPHEQVVRETREMLDRWIAEDGARAVAL